MKKTFLMLINPMDPSAGLREASKDEWKQMLWNNRGLPKEKRRHFIIDCCDDDYKTLDCMYIETTYEEYKKWQTENQAKYRNRMAKKNYSFVSLYEKTLQNGETVNLLETVPDNFKFEDMVIDGIILEDLRIALSKWKKWANEMLDYYIDGKEKVLTADLKDKYKLSYSVISKRKRMLREFIKNFYSQGVWK